MAKANYNQFYDGTWEWENNGLVFRNSRKIVAAVPNTLKSSSMSQVTCAHGEVVFKDSSSTHVQSLFFHQYRRKDYLSNGPDVVTMQDVKDVVFFLSNNVFVNETFIRMFNSEKINSFLRALILYFDLFLKVWNDLMERRLFKDEKLKHHTSVYRETRCKMALRELRCKLGQYYAYVLLGEDGFKHYHHSMRSLNEDNALSEMFKRYCARFVWITLGRIQFNQIQSEMKRLFRSEASSSFVQSKFGSTLDTHDFNLIYGDESGFIPIKSESSYYFQKSAPIFDVINYAKDFKDSSFQLVNKDTLFKHASINHIEAAIIMPEELLETVGIDLGIIGKLRRYHEPLLQPKEKEEDLEQNEGRASRGRYSRNLCFTKVLLTTLDRLYNEVVLPERVRVLGRNYGFVEAVRALDREHLQNTAISRKQWLAESSRL